MTRPIEVQPILFRRAMGRGYCFSDSAVVRDYVVLGMTLRNSWGTLNDLHTARAIVEKAAAEMGEAVRKQAIEQMMACLPELLKQGPQSPHNEALAVTVTGGDEGDAIKVEPTVYPRAYAPSGDCKSQADPRPYGDGPAA